MISRAVTEIRARPLSAVRRTGSQTNSGYSIIATWNPRRPNTRHADKAVAPKRQARSESYQGTMILRYMEFESIRIQCFLFSRQCGYSELMSV